jgi:hypothetical protein
MDFGQQPVFGITALRGQSPTVEFFPHRQRAHARKGSLKSVDRFQLLQSRTESRGHTVFQFRPGKKTSSIPRRALLMGGFAGAVSCAFPGVGNAATAIDLPTGGGNRRFSVLYKGFKIGAHRLSYSSATGETRVDTEIDLSVKVAFLSVFAFSHRSQETWRAGRLVSLNSQTVEQGETLHVEGAAMPQGFRVMSKAGPVIASPATLTSNTLWTPAMLEQATVVDAQRGGIMGVSARKFADEQIVIAGSPVRATRYTVITPFFAGTVWYDKANLWVRAEFERDGSKVEYQLDA